MRLWTLKVPPVWNAEEEALLLRWTPPQRREKPARKRNDGAVRLAAYALEGAAAYLLANVPPEEQVYDTELHGKPYLRGVPAYRHNLSHSGNRVLLGAGEREIGVDIEQIRAFSPRLLTRFFLKEEQAFADTDERATALWTRKEAVCKWNGLGLAGLSAARVLEGENADRLFTHRDGDYMLSVCSDELKGAPSLVSMDSAAFCHWLRQI